MIARAQMRAVRGAYAPPRVLLVEQDVQLLAVLIELFAGSGYQVDTALPEDDLRRVVLQRRPRLVLLGDGACGSFEQGWSAAWALRAADPRLPLLMLTSDAQALAEVGTTLRGGMFAAGIRKPFPVSELLAAAYRLCPPGGSLERSA